MLDSTRMVPGSSAEDAVLYQRLAHKLGQQILKGILRPGDKLPSVRSLSRHEGVSITSILSAYMLLESSDLIESRPQSGFYVKAHAADLPPEARNECKLRRSQVQVSELAQQVLSSMHDCQMVALGAVMPAAELLPVAKLARIISGIQRRNPELLARYDLPPGRKELRREIAKRAVHNGFSVDADELVITCGAMEAIHLSLQAVASPGDMIAIESPMYFSILQCLEVLGMRAVEIPTHPRDGMQLSALRSALKKFKIKAVVAMPNFNNPLGSLMPTENKKELVSLLARHEIPLIEDDFFGDVPFGESRPQPAKAFDKKGLVLWCGSYSKTISPALRIGWVAAGRFSKAIQYRKLVTSVGNSPVSQLAVAEYLRFGNYDRHLRKLRSAFIFQTQRMMQAVNTYFPSGTHLSRPQGGCMLWVEFPKHIDAVELHQRALSEGISISPGPLFSATGRYRNCIRLNTGNPWSEQIERALARIGSLARECSRKKIPQKQK